MNRENGLEGYSHLWAIGMTIKSTWLDDALARYGFPDRESSNPIDYWEFPDTHNLIFLIEPNTPLKDLV